MGIISRTKWRTSRQTAVPLIFVDRPQIPETFPPPVSWCSSIIIDPHSRGDFPLELHHPHSSPTRIQLVLKLATPSPRHRNSPILYFLLTGAKSAFFLAFPPVCEASPAPPPTQQLTPLPRVRHCLPLVHDCLIHAAALALLTALCLPRQESRSLRPKYPLLRLIAVKYVQIFSLLITGCVAANN